MSKVVPDMG